MRRSPNVATPSTSLACVVPERVAQGAAPVPAATRTTPPGTRLQEASVTVTWIAGEITALALTVAGGGTVKSTCAGALLGPNAGDQLGSMLSPAVFVSRVWPDPSAFIT